MPALALALVLALALALALAPTLMCEPTLWTLCILMSNYEPVFTVPRTHGIYVNKTVQRRGGSTQPQHGSSGNSKT